MKGLNFRDSIYIFRTHRSMPEILHCFLLCTFYKAHFLLMLSQMLRYLKPYQGCNFEDLLSSSSPKPCSPLGQNVELGRNLETISQKVTHHQTYWLVNPMSNVCCLWAMFTPDWRNFVIKQYSSIRSECCK